MIEVQHPFDPDPDDPQEGNPLLAVLVVAAVWAVLLLVARWVVG